jgi:hypothetical protein
VFRQRFERRGCNESGLCGRRKECASAGCVG